MNEKLLKIAHKQQNLEYLKKQILPRRINFRNYETRFPVNIPRRFWNSAVA